jgi:hypothetical protein
VSFRWSLLSCRYSLLFYSRSVPQTFTLNFPPPPTRVVAIFTT